MKGFSITRGGNIFTIRSDTFCLKDFVNIKLKIILEDKFQYGACNVNPLLRNWDIITTRHKIKTYFKLLLNLLGISSVNGTFSNESIP